MPKPYSRDLRERVVRGVEAGASCHEAAAAFEVSPSSAIRWVARWRQSGSVAAKPMGGKRSPLDAHKAWLLDLIAAEPDRGSTKAFAATLAHTMLHAPSFSLRGGAREILRGIIARGLGVR